MSEANHGADGEDKNDGAAAASALVTGAVVDTRIDSEVIGSVVSTDSSPTFFAIDFRLNAEKATRPGKFVAIGARTTSGQSSLILARVNDVHEVNPHEDPHSSNLRNVLPFETKYAKEGHSTVIFRVASAEPLEEALLDDDGKVTSIRSVETLPQAGAPVFDAGADLTISALGLEPMPDDGFHMGTAQGDPATPIVLSKSVVQRHIFIGGGIGSGKSYTRGVLAEELHSWGVPQINIDVNGEMIDATAELGGTNLVPGKGFTIPLSALSSADVLEAVPSINAGTNMETLLRFTHEVLQKEIAEGKRKFFTAKDLIDKMEDCAWMLELTSGSGDNRKLEQRTVQPTKNRAETALRRLAFLGNPFDWKSMLKPGAVINIDCRTLSLTELRLITASIARDLQQLAKAREIPFAVLSIDEFHLVAPNGDDTVTTSVLREIARIGRHYKLGLILTTQSPSDVDKSILKRLLTRFLHAIEPDQLDALRSVFSDASDDLVRSLPKLPQGTCIISGAFETVRHAAVVRIRPRRTTHGGKTPDIWSEIAKAGWTGKRPPSSKKENADGTR